MANNDIKVPVGLSISLDMLTKVDKAAAERGIPRSRFVVEALLEKLEKLKNNSGDTKRVETKNGKHFKF